MVWLLRPVAICWSTSRSRADSPSNADGSSCDLRASNTSMTFGSRADPLLEEIPEAAHPVLEQLEGVVVVGEL